LSNNLPITKESLQPWSVNKKAIYRIRVASPKCPTSVRIRPTSRENTSTFDSTSVRDGYVYKPKHRMEYIAAVLEKKGVIGLSFLYLPSSCLRSCKTLARRR
jgi:hypothetical protein